MSPLADHPRCPDCQASMLFDGAWYCANEDCPKVSQPFTLREIENREEANGERSQQTGAEAWAGGIVEGN